MNGHWSEEEISQWMAEGRDRARASHLDECAVCAAEVARMETALGEFREAVKSWSAAQTPAAFWREARVRNASGLVGAPTRRGVPVLRWAAGMAALIVISAIPVYQHRQQQARRAEMARADAVLLEQVDAEVSQAVPEPMQPLVALVSWNSTTEEKGDVR